MSYEADLKHLRTTLEKFEKIHSDAVVNGDHMDEMLYKENIDNVKHQIHIHEQAAKLPEYEAKAKAFDAIKKEVAEELKRLTVIQADFPLAFESKIETLKNVMASMTQYESGEYDAKK